MSETNLAAVGIHDHPTQKLGLRPADPAAQSLMLDDYLTGEVPDHPTSEDYLKGIAFGMYGNNQWGVCGPTAVANSRREVTYRLTGKMLAPTQDDVFRLYRQSGNPNFDPATGADDNGVVMTTMLAALMKYGIGGVKPLGWAKVKASDPELLKAAVATLGFQLYGVTLQKAQQGQTDQGKWSYSPSGEWGGHAVLGGAYDGDSIDVITWVKVVQMLQSFVQHQLDEAYCVIWPEHLSSPGFLRGVDVQKFARDWEAFSGQKFPVPVPTPPPGPAPVGNGVLTINPETKTILYPAGWTAAPAPTKSDFDLV